VRPITERPAYQRGVRRATEDMAKATGIDPDTVTVSTAGTTDDWYARSHFRLCRLCGWGVSSGRCHCKGSP